MPRSIWNGMISFGMVSIPVKMFSATESKDISFNQVHKLCETRIRYQKYCPHCDRSVEQDELERGYEFAKGQYVVLDDEDFEQLPLPSKHTIEISAFVKLDQIDPIYFEKSYYVEPDEAATRPFVLLMRALTGMGMIAIGTVTLRNKERLCALRAMGGTLVMDTLLYPDEIRVSADKPLPNVKINEKELQMATHLVELMEQDFDPDQYKDHYREALKKVIEAKLEGKEIVYAEEAPKGKVIDLMEALRASVENLRSERQPLKAQARPGSHKAAAKSASREKTAKGSTAARTKSPEKKSASAASSRGRKSKSA